MLASLEKVTAAARAASDPGLVLERGHVGLGGLGRGEVVVVRDGEQDLVVEQGSRDEGVEVLLATPEVGALVDERHGEVALTGAQGGQGLAGLGLAERDGDAGVVGLDLGEGLGDERGRGAGEGHEADPAGAEPGDGRNLLLGGVERREHRSGVAREDGAGLGEPDATTDTLDEGGARPCLESPHHLRDGGLGVAQRERRRREACLRRRWRA